MGVLKILQYSQENTFVGLQAFNFINKRLQHRCFPMNSAKFLKTDFFIEHFWWLLLYLGQLQYLPRFGEFVCYERFQFYERF